MARKQRKQSNRFDDYDESYDDDEFEYEVADDVCADDDAEGWSPEEEDGYFDESERTLHSYRRKPRGVRPTPPPARSVGKRENPDYRKKMPPPSRVRPPARKPSPSSRSNRNRLGSGASFRDGHREREQPVHGPHFWDQLRSRPHEQTSQKRQRGTGNPAHRSDQACSNAQPAKNGGGWRRFLLLMFLLACGTAYTFYATLNVPHEGNAHIPSPSEDHPSSPHDDEKQQATERGTSERPDQRTDQRTETRQTGDSSRETTAPDTPSSEEHSDDPPGLRTQERRTSQEQESESHVAWFPQNNNG